MDFKMEVVSTDEETGTAKLCFKPDPERYEWCTVSGEKALYDKLDRAYIPLRVLMEGMRLGKGTPIYYQPPMIDNAKEYISSRADPIREMLDGKRPAVTFEDKSDEFLASLAVDELGFVIMSVDMVGSTRLASELDGRAYAELIEILLYELSEVVPKFHGHVLKYTGDGFIAYFPEPSFNTKNDLAIDCALTIRGLVYQLMNQLFTERALPEIGIRIGMEAGDAYVVTIGSPETKQHKDIVGEVISLAAKIEKQANPGDILIGNMMERSLHTSWRLMCEPVEIAPDWTYKDRDGSPYLIHRFTGHREAPRS